MKVVASVHSRNSVSTTSHGLLARLAVLSGTVSHSPANNSCQAQHRGGSQVIRDLCTRWSDFGHTQMPTAVRRTVSVPWLAWALCAMDCRYSLLPQNAGERDRTSANVIRAGYCTNSVSPFVESGASDRCLGITYCKCTGRAEKLPALWDG